MMMMMTTTMTMLLTTLYICTCKQNVRKQKQFGRYTGTLPYSLDLPDGQLMIGSKVVGTVGRTLSLSLITKEKKASWTVCHFISMGKTKSKRKAWWGRAEGGNKLILSYNARWYTQTLTDSLTDSHFRTTTAGLSGTVGNCVCVCCFLAFSNQRINRKKGT